MLVMIVTVQTDNPPDVYCVHICVLFKNESVIVRTLLEMRSYDTQNNYFSIYFMFLEVRAHNI